ncbi:neutral zinc metallopeptidase [Salana multivorans]
MEFWEAETEKPIERPVVIEPEFPPEPQECFAPQQYYAWYCSDNQTIYINTSMLELWQEHFTEDEVPYSLAATMAHEVGHAAQFALRPELAELDTRDPKISLPIEMEADCLAGVWAAGPITEGRLDRETLERVWGQQIELLNDEEHQQTHGLPADRVARLSAGIDGGVEACWQDGS